MKKTLIGVIIIVIVFLAGDILWQKYFKPAPKQVSNFTECAALGNPVMESYPRQCRANGQTFVEEINNNEESTSQAIQKLFAIKYPKYAQTVTVKVEKEIADFASGSVRFAEATAGGLWFAAKTEQGWELAFDGNGIIPCAATDKYGMPREMVPLCVDSENNNNLLQR